MSLIEDIKQDEGFKGDPYYCSEGMLTVGYGTTFPLDEAEAELLLNYRLNKTIGAIKSSLYDLDIEDEAWDILYNMSYQIGVNGLLKFKKMIKALRNQNYLEASKEGIDSLWYRQTPKRAERLMSRMKALAWLV